ncbi:hypothetical protein [Deinococcus pimensis]|uniref:hypothetical protein n=1 Tax=Deinococcus pimensis TaxID=309888 RepID=UPI0004AD655D|nr:hypothetical protein [Deinococcus pimensis]
MTLDGVCQLHSNFGQSARATFVTVLLENPSQAEDLVAVVELVWRALEAHEMLAARQLGVGLALNVAAERTAVRGSNLSLEAQERLLRLALSVLPDGTEQRTRGLLSAALTGVERAWAGRKPCVGEGAGTPSTLVVEGAPAYEWKPFED